MNDFLKSTLSPIYHKLKEGIDEIGEKHKTFFLERSNRAKEGGKDNIWKHVVLFQDHAQKCKIGFEEDSDMPNNIKEDIAKLYVECYGLNNI